MFEASGILMDRLRVAAAVIAALDARCARAQASEEWLAAWKDRCGILGKQVKARAGARVIAGEVVEIEPLHGLVLRDAGGGVHFLSAQETSLAGNP